MKKTMKTLVLLLSILSAGLTTLLYIKIRAPKGFALWIPKLAANGLAAYAGLAGLVSAITGAFCGAWVAVAAGLAGAIAAANYLYKVVLQAHLAMYPRFAKAFGPDWESRLALKATPQQKDAMLSWRWTWFAPAGDRPCLERNVPFWSDPTTGRQLLCDLWLPPERIPATGLGIVYFHGSAWYLGDKDFGTRSFFRHLAAQGHLVMDAQYRLAPEVDAFGMIADVKQAVAWLKANADAYAVDPRRVVLMGASAGGQLALLAAYAPQHPRLTPPDLLDTDLSVRAVAAYYGPGDLRACYYHTRQNETPFAALQTQQENTRFGRMMNRVMTLVTGNSAMGEEMARKFANMAIAGRLEPVLGGTPDEALENYILASPITHAGKGCPPTFLVQGEDDLIVPVDTNRRMADQLAEAGVPVVHLVLPHTEHGFDLMLPLISPPAQSALYELDRFLALVG
jgi:acetyl esterase/lipase